jgi:hypothetical protein
MGDKNPKNKAKAQKKKDSDKAIAAKQAADIQTSKSAAKAARKDK